MAPASLARNSLARRFVLVFGLGTPLTLVLLGACLALMLNHQIERRDMTELDGKSEVVSHLLAEIQTPDDIEQQVHRVGDVAIGHHFLQLGIMRDGRWLLRPNDTLAAYIEEKGIYRQLGSEMREEVELGDQYWWLRQLSFQVSPQDTKPLHALIAVDVSEAKAFSSRFNTALALLGLAGSILMGALAWWGTRKALAPLDTIAAKAEEVTVHGLGKALSISDAPVEVHGLVLSINHMLGRLGESFNALEQFSSNIAHELRTPLNAMQLRTEVTLSKDRTDTEYRDALDQSLVEINRLERMVTNMLFIARADRQMETAALDQVCLEDELRDTIDYFTLAASERDQTIRLSGCLRTMCDRSMMLRAVTNLVSNGIRYSPDGAAIEVQLLNFESDAIIRVTNPSRAYSEHEIEHLFDRFVRHENEQTPAGDGLGLGLPIVRSIMQMHAGTVTARAIPGGVVFELRWPATVDERQSGGAGA